MAIAAEAVTVPTTVPPAPVVSLPVATPRPVSA